MIVFARFQEFKSANQSLLLKLINFLLSGLLNLPDLATIHLTSVMQPYIEHAISIIPVFTGLKFFWLRTAFFGVKAAQVGHIINWKGVYEISVLSVI